MSNVSSALERAKEKLALPVAGNNSNVAPEPFPLVDLPSDRNANLWTEIRTTYGLSLVELGALQNFACSGNYCIQSIL